ncbi:M48 family metalloprotease [Nodularia spumigena CS-584]|jgi:beta-barrel assembly-enhancing protease|uniref:Beta-barrel assembly-enhancing protease n=2 Tax=Nodularia spumigena TaxID=70799 RepID=A0A2S0Q6K2_NODSP|nr:M48 family metalloprotease [Nodularia spumigena]AHJ27508.1 Zinc metalloprotease [Nodularia spumigena CCY9414]AVZ30011.1 beta-barrel assembly-enhancing protease [Nodularia spumigena UHCC 0039]MDB9381976.1 M48 family metalloprotease [Nodularia spumigena CS-584]MEA5525703.1 M48 family metalloprotease [Nodularia spumigena UHCC 0143]MEA5555672.1 M48 family metalloprotease [Nodularia spumigena CH309]
MNWNSFFGHHHSQRRRWFYPLISVVVALTLCLSTPMPGNAFDIRSLLFQGIQVIQMSNMSDRQEVDLGKQMNQQLQSGDIRFSRNSQINRYVEQIGQRLVASSSRPNLPFTFQVVEDDAINAFATLGGFVYIHTGLMKAAENEAELASVIGHEIGHITGRHLVQQMRQRAIANGVASAAGLERNAAVGIGLELALNRPRSRQDEFDADNRGLLAMTEAGYAPSGMVSFMQKLMQKRGSIPAFLSTHPGTSDRINALQNSINAQPSKQRDGLDNAAYRANIRSIL